MRIDRFNYPCLFVCYKEYCKYPKLTKRELLNYIDINYGGKVFEHFCIDCEQAVNLGVKERKDFYNKLWISCIDNLYRGRFAPEYVSEGFAKRAQDNCKSICEGVAEENLHSLLGDTSGYMILGEQVVVYSIVKGLAFFKSDSKMSNKSLYSVSWGAKMPIFDEAFDNSMAFESIIEHKKAIFTCMAVLLMKKYGEVETVECSGNSKTKISETEDFYNGAPFSVTRIDSTWLRTIVRTEGFQVRGFWRLQACGRNWGERKLIYIDSFQKHGYVRRAKKLIQEEKENRHSLLSVA